MGRTVATFRDLIEQELQTWQRTFGRALRREERAYLESMFHRVRLYAQACTYQFPVNAMEAINVAIGLDHEIRLRAIEACLGINLETQWMDSRPLSLPRGDGDLADRIVVQAVFLCGGARGPAFPSCEDTRSSGTGELFFYREDLHLGRPASARAGSSSAAAAAVFRSGAVCPPPGQHLKALQL